MSHMEAMRLKRLGEKREREALRRVIDCENGPRFVFARSTPLSRSRYA